MPVQEQRGDGDIGPNHLQSWQWNSVGCWPGPYPAAVCWERHTHCLGGWMGLSSCLVRHGKSHLFWISISIASRMTRVWFQTGKASSPYYHHCCFFLQCSCTVYCHLCRWWYTRWMLETQYWKWTWRWWSYEVDHTSSCGTETENECSFTLTLPWNGDAVETVTWAASLLCFFTWLHLCIDH
jgi:hypothetical protein